MQYMAMHQTIDLGQVLLSFRDVGSCNAHCHVG